MGRGRRAVDFVRLSTMAADVSMSQRLGGSTPVLWGADGIVGHRFSGADDDLGGSRGAIDYTISDPEVQLQ